MTRTMGEFREEGGRVLAKCIALRGEIIKTQTREPETWGSLFYHLGLTMAFHQATSGDEAVSLAVAAIQETGDKCVGRKVLTEDAINRCVQEGYDAGMKWLEVLP
jgi:hypothetical protein